MTQAQNANDLAKEALVSVQRAFIFLNSRDYKVDEHRIPGYHVKSIHLYFPWENSGTTPARNFRGSIKNEFFGKRIVNEAELIDAETSERPGVIGPKDVFLATGGTVTAEEWVKASNRQGHIYFWGWARDFRAYSTSQETPPILPICARIVRKPFAS